MAAFEDTNGYRIILQWMEDKGNYPFKFQVDTWKKFGNGYSGMVIAPTGFGKTFSVFLALISDFLSHPERYGTGLKMIWVTPLRSLAKDIAKAMQEAMDEIGLDWVVGVRNGDTDPKVRQQQVKSMPEILVVTPESLHLLLAQKNHERFFKNLHCIAVDEWHELLGSKRGVMIELGIAQLKKYVRKLKIWGITATIGNLDEAMEVLIPYDIKKAKITAKEHKKIDILPVFPDEIEILPWAGHLGAKMADKIVPIILNSRSTIVFTNTRSQSEMWYQLLLDAYPDFAGQLAIHHSSIDAHLRIWIEENLSNGKLKAVVSTSSLDLGIDFKPVDTVIQIGSSKGVARFLQRAGRSGHSPFETSRIYCVPTHSLELIEVAALKEAVKQKVIEPREPQVLCFDVLVQFLMTLAVGDGFMPDEVYSRVKQTFAFRDINDEEWKGMLEFLTIGGSVLKSYEEFHKVVITDEGLYKVTSRKIAMLHRMNMGVIVSDAMLKVKFISGGYIGMIEEYFISRLKKDEKFILAGRTLEVAMIKDMTVFVRAASGKALVPSYLGGRLPLSSNLSVFLREKLSGALNPKASEKELKFLHPLLARQEERSHIPKDDEFLVELIKNREGYHLFMYPFEGRLVHEVMAALIAYRISKLAPISFSMAMNDYGFELFSDKEIPLNEENLNRILTRDNLMTDVISSINAAEMASRKFRDIAVISGMVIQNYAGKQRSNKSLQSSAGLIFKVLEDHDPNHFLVRQAYTEVFNIQLQEPRLVEAFRRIENSRIILKYAKTFTPLSFPIKIDSLRQTLSSEGLDARIQRLLQQANRSG
ncbi:ATP-dependent Lhr-like helicase [Chryseobacterium sp. SORGH_AS909]|uniref:ATP-dependent Lhr-like helicase n=2 Tax=Chryseobacterium group TaxID=2782232 RepID=A0ABU0TGR7_9FLAO|nr:MULTISPECIES: ligase-associated DNA damage response DEXH box helicase [Chryseobacterium]MDT3405943.1 ATP-dependent Lhr-like helicase [Pseudacidovorax intermedius]MDQ1096253.1 ATP-dependent Lhr-like helicase [Chryseobacterium camelliae]MDQ1100190.1 ATP-dependent Lhr-like helicase [Chryseobacterium sp. SORGH_AS_1048]MDR6087535.1 ATP-dependent Lhr-like helicase [Chryseobacterium sp. SORGH_AS_0909]MDR6131909.1 ATP-dependent Lhr-like helicase [Chryseobacterium sp. SORGH_AS_1175]